MSDLISREALKDTLYHIRCNLQMMDDTRTADKMMHGLRLAEIALEDAPTIDAVPRQKYEEDMENAFAHGYTDAESKYRKMIEGGELVDVVRCKDCKHWTQSMGKMKGYGLGRCDFHDADLVTCNGYCYWAERRTDE